MFRKYPTDILSISDIVDTDYELVLDVYGAVDPLNESLSLGVLYNVSYALLVSEDGDVVATLPVDTLRPLQEYVATCRLNETSMYRVVNIGSLPSRTAKTLQPVDRYSNRAPQEHVRVLFLKT